MSWYSWQLQLSKSCRPLPLARTYAARPDSPFWRLRIALATKRRALARSALPATFGIPARSSADFDRHSNICLRVSQQSFPVAEMGPTPRHEPPHSRPAWKSVFGDYKPLPSPWRQAVIFDRTAYGRL